MPRNEHFIPKFYQMSWKCAEENKHVWSFDKKNRTIKKSAIKHTCSKDDLYEDDKNQPTGFLKQYISKNMRINIVKSIRGCFLVIIVCLKYQIMINK